MKIRITSSCTGQNTGIFKSMERIRSAIKRRSKIRFRDRWDSTVA